MKLFLCPNGFTGEQVEQAINCAPALVQYGEYDGHKRALSSADSNRLPGDDCCV